jgi:hypothetical protein
MLLSRRMMIKSALVAAAAWITPRSMAGNQGASIATPLAPERRILRVGPGRPLASPAEAAKVARDGDEIQIENAQYRRDVAVWPQSGLRLVGIGGKPSLLADGASAQGKAIWVIQGDNVEVVNLLFEGCKVEDDNGAGIRAEGKRLTVRQCVFRDNETAILTANRPDAELTIEFCELDRNYTRTGRWMHNIYVGLIDQFSMRYCYVHHGVTGHNVKTRARHSVVEYNLIADHDSGRASYAVEFPSGGISLLRGNIIQHGRHSENPHVVSIGAEDLHWPDNHLEMVHNTLIDELPNHGIFVGLRKPRIALRALNNLFIGPGKLEPIKSGTEGNLRLGHEAVLPMSAMDFALHPGRIKIALPKLRLAPLNGEAKLRCVYVHPLGQRCAGLDFNFPGAMPLERA